METKLQKGENHSNEVQLSSNFVEMFLRMMNIHITRLKLAKYVLTRNHSPKFMAIKTFKSMII